MTRLSRQAKTAREYRVRVAKEQKYKYQNFKTEL